MRRNGATRRIQEKGCNPTNQLENSSSSLLESVESGQILTAASNGQHQHSNGLVHPNDLNGDISGGRPKQPRRFRKSDEKRLSLNWLKRRLMFHLRRKPKLVKRMLIFAAAAFLVVFWVSLFIMGMIQHRSTPSALVSPPERKLGDKDLSSSSSTSESIDRRLSQKETASKKNIAKFELEQRKFVPKFDVIFKGGFKGEDSLYTPDKLDPANKNEGLLADYGNLEFKFLEEEGARRNIFYDYDLYKTEFRDHDKHQDDDVDMYYAFDDDYQRGHDTAFNDQDVIDDNKHCRRISGYRLNFQTCNLIHELNRVESNVKYLSAGSYRQVTVIDHDFANESEPVIVKELHMDNDIQYDMFEFVRMDAIVAERLTSSPRIFDMYGFCGVTIISEFFSHGDIEAMAVPGDGYLKTEMIRRNEFLKPRNSFPAIEKLNIATQMAEAIADLHGYPGGVIVHGDIQLSQFLYTNDKSKVKLNDFNRAEFMLWDDENGEYCRYTNGRGHGNWRAPEEYKDAPLNEKVDVWSLGNNMYSLLTGLWVFYDEEKDSKMQARVKNGETAYIDPRYRDRSLAEGKLVEAIEKCFAYKASDRASIFEIATFLRQSLTTLTDMEYARIQNS